MLCSALDGTGFGVATGPVSRCRICVFLNRLKNPWRCSPCTKYHEADFGDYPELPL